MISKELVIKTIHQFFYEQIEKTPLITDEDGEHYITAKVEPFLEMNKELSKLIDSIPDQDKCGHWIEKKAFVYCSECAFGFDIINKHDYKFCPNCGARMESEYE